MATTHPGGIYQTPDGQFVNANGQPVEAPSSVEAPDSPPSAPDSPPASTPQTGTADEFARTDEGAGRPAATGPEDAAKAVKSGKDAK